MKRSIASDKVAIYIRWSTEDQGQGHTLEIQQESCRYYCLSQGWLVRDDLTFIDEGWSGSNLERPALTRLRAEAAAGNVECVVVYKLDRLSRNIKDIINLALDEWEDTCNVRSTQEPVDTTSDAGKMFFTMLGSFADFERSTIKTRTWSGKMKNAQKGRNPGIPYPFGYQKAEGGGWEIVESEALVVRRMYMEYLRGKSCRKIAHALNAEGCRTRSGTTWADASISRLLRNPIYMGRLMYNRRNFAGRKKNGGIVQNADEEIVTVAKAVPAIVDDEAWKHVERLRASRPRVNRGKPARTASSPYLLSGLLKCKCGHSWIGIQGGNDGRFYACAGARSQGEETCKSRMIGASALDAFVMEKVRETWPVKGAFTAEIFSGLAQRLREHAARVQAIRKRLGATEGSLERFRDDYKMGKLSADVYMDLIRDARTERQKFMEQLNRAESERLEIEGDQVDLEQAGVWFERMDAWETLGLEEKQQCLRMLINHVVVSRPKGSRDVSIHVEWRLPLHWSNRDVGD